MYMPQQCLFSDSIGNLGNQGGRHNGAGTYLEDNMPRSKINWCRSSSRRFNVFSRMTLLTPMPR